MPGIFGIVHQDQSRLSRLAGDMSAVMQHHDWYASERQVCESFAGGTMALSAAAASQSIWRSAAGNCILLDGEIEDTADWQREFSRAGFDHSPSAAALLLTGFESAGEAFFARVSGYFSCAIWQPSAASLLLVTDRFGMKPLYYASLPDGLAFASEVKALLQCPAVRPTRSLRGAAQFFTFGHLLGTDTLYESVRAAGPAACITYAARDRRLAKREYWQLTPAPPVDGTRVLEQLEGAFRTAVERRVDGPKRVGLSLSGGLDARTILAAVPAGVPIKTVSLGIQGSIDHRVASRLAAMAGAEHHTHFLDARFLERFPQHLQTLVWLTDGHYLDQAITVPTLPVYRQLGIDSLLRGHAGELLHMDKAYAFSIKPDELGFRNREAVESWLWHHLTAYMIAGIGHDVFRSELRKDAADHARDSLRQALVPAHGFAPPAQELWYLFITERLRRETAMSMQMFTSVVDVRLPYVDNAVVDLVMRMPPALKIGDRIQSFILAHTRPEFLRVTNANTGTRLGAGRVARELSSFRLRVLSKLRVPGYQPYERLGLWLSEELQPLVRELVLGERTLDRGLFDPAVLRRAVDEHSRRVRNHTFLLMALMIYEAGQRQLADADGKPPSYPAEAASTV